MWTNCTHTMTEMREDAALLSDFNMPIYSSDCTPETILEIPLRETDMKSQTVQSRRRQTLRQTRRSINTANFGGYLHCIAQPQCKSGHKILKS